MGRREEALRVFREKGVVRPRDLAAHGIDSKYLTLLRREGVVERVGRGLYVLAEAEVSEHHSLAEAAKRVPQGVVCLLSALRFHDLTTQQPFEIWMALEEKAWRPKVEELPLRFVRFSGRAWEYGVEEHRIDGVPVRIYGVAKTVADCFKYRNKIGLDVALEALREAWAERRVSMDQLWEAAAACRMRNVMRPYLEALA